MYEATPDRPDTRLVGTSTMYSFMSGTTRATGDGHASLDLLLEFNVPRDLSRDVWKTDEVLNDSSDIVGHSLWDGSSTMIVLGPVLFRLSAWMMTCPSVHLLPVSLGICLPEFR